MYRTSNINDSFAIMFASGFAIFFALISIAVSIVQTIAIWKIFEKAGKPGWAAIIPVYNLWVFFEIVDIPGPLSLLLVLPIFTFYIPVIRVLAMLTMINSGITLSLILCIRLPKKFGLDPAFALGLIFIPAVFFPILGFGKSEYVDKVQDKDLEQK